MATNRNVILWCESAPLRRTLSHYLQENAFSVISCNTLEGIRMELGIGDFTLLITDTTCDDGRLEAIVSKQPTMQVLHITEQAHATHNKQQWITLPPPFDLSEIGRLLQQRKPAEPDALPLGKYDLLPAKNSIRYQNIETTLPKKEMELLLLLYRNRPDMISKEIVCRKLWPESPSGHDNSIHVYINNLRRFLLQDDSIRLISVYGKGFRLVCS